MAENRAFQNWPRVNDKMVVEEMLRNRSSGQWQECHEFVKTLVQTKAKNIPKDQWEDIIQNTMIRFDKSLATFKFDCSIRTWIFGIAHNCIIDFYRKSKRVEQFITVVCQWLCKISVSGCLVDGAGIVSLLKCKLRMTA